MLVNITLQSGCLEIILSLIVILLNLNFYSMLPSDKKGSVKRRTKEEYLRIFMEFDADNSGSVSKSEIMKMFKACEMQIDEEEAEDLMNEIDADGGGELQQDEFI